MTDLESAWLAGLLEGEGYFQITKPRHHHPTQVVIRLSMTDKDVVEKAAKLLNNIPINQKARTTERKTIYTISLSKKDEVEKIIKQRNKGISGMSKDKNNTISFDNIC